MLNENCRQSGHCYCSEVEVGGKPHMQCCNCSHKSLRVMATSPNTTGSVSTTGSVPSNWINTSSFSTLGTPYPNHSLMN